MQAVEDHNDNAAIEARPIIMKITPPSVYVTKPTLKPLRTRVVVVNNNIVAVPVECCSPPDPGACAKDLIRLFYDQATRTCKPFSYTGELG